VGLCTSAQESLVMLCVCRKVHEPAVLSVLECQTGNQSHIGQYKGNQHIWSI